MTIELNENNFNEITKTPDQAVLVDFWAPWCGPCKQLSPTLDEISKELNGKAIIAKVNVDDYPDLAAKYNVRGIPTMILFKNGEVVDTKVGALPKNSLLDWIDAVS